ncbi:HAD family hydrolase [Schumannella luteola]|uniref:Cof-type HAD-IIB family hydrolase n=1 Tax=Schumannella luteola TaxID=472059 RepID=A0A852YLZ3_9MICO|nr:HAD family hydrolase [Schumannella luteola]NYH00209.1 hypothetical protein [Schumannella luteola]TPX04042.1 HAD family hydrolase [Schumannella luteola]
MTTRRRLIFLDVDGTLLDHGERLSPGAVAAVRGAREAGHLVFVCTGRARAEIPTIITDIGFDGDVTAGGGFVELDGELVAARTMQRERVVETIDFLQTRGIEFLLQSFDAVHPSAGLADRLRPFFERYGAWTGAPEFEDASIHLVERDWESDPELLDRIAKITFFGDDPTTFATVRDGLGEHFHVITGSIPFLGESGGEVSPVGVHKGSAILAVLERLGESIDDVVAIGDSANDIEMIAIAGLGIAMGNADGAVKAVADEVTASVADDGVWKAFQRHGLLAR